MRVATALAAGLLLAGGAAGAQTYLGPTPYLSQADSPFAAALATGAVVLEDFEDGTLLAGVSAPTGAVVAPGGFTDSVDADDGAVDGSGTNGHSFFTGTGLGGVRFDFDPAAFGGYPTAVGVVWTDGGGTVTFEAFDRAGATLGLQGPFALPDGFPDGGTAEDRFFGVTHPTGISRIRVASSAAGTEVDHLQLSRVHPLDVFLCRAARPTRGAPAFARRVAALADAFEVRDTDVVRPKALCTAADAEGAGFLDPDARLTSYQIKSAEKHAKVPRFDVTNRIGPLALATVKPDRLLVPAAAGAPLARGAGPALPAIDAFKCYKAKVAKGTEKLPKGVQLALADAFEPLARRFDLKKPSRLCLPVDVDGAGVDAPAALLVCYAAKPARGEPKHAKQTGVATTDSFGDLVLDTVKDQEVCVPSGAVLVP